MLTSGPTLTHRFSVLEEIQRRVLWLSASTIHRNVVVLISDVIGSPGA